MSIDFYGYYWTSVSLMFFAMILLPVKKPGSLGHVFLSVTAALCLGWAVWWAMWIITIVTRWPGNAREG